MSTQPAALPDTSSPGIPNESTTLERIQVKLVEALHEMQRASASQGTSPTRSVRAESATWSATPTVFRKSGRLIGRIRCTAQASCNATRCRRKCCRLKWT